MLCPKHFSDVSLQDGRAARAARLGKVACAVVASFWLSLVLLVLQRAANAANPAFSFSPDGARIMTFDINATMDTSGAKPIVSSDSTASLWDAHTGKRIAVLRGHTATLTGASFSPDGLRIVTASQDTTARLWNGQTGAPIATLRGYKYAVTSATFSPDGTRIVTTGASENSRLRDGHTGKLIQALPTAASLASFSPDGTRLLACCADSVGLWDAGSGKLITRLPGVAEQATAARFSPDGTRIAVVTGGFTPARLWDGHTGALAVKLTTATGADQRDMLNVESAVFSADSARFAIAASGGTYLWDARTGKLVAPIQTTIPIGGHPIATVFFSSDSARLVAANLDRSVAAWDAHAGKLIGALQPASLAAQSGSMDDQFDVALSPDGTRLVTLDGISATLRDGVTGKMIAALPIPAHPASESPPHPAVLCSPDGSRFVTTSNDSNTVLLWDARAGKLVAMLTGNRRAVTLPAR